MRICEYAYICEYFSLSLYIYMYICVFLQIFIYIYAHIKLLTNGVHPQSQPLPAGLSPGFQKANHPGIIPLGVMGTDIDTIISHFPPLFSPDTLLAFSRYTRSFINELLGIQSAPRTSPRPLNNAHQTPGDVRDCYKKLQHSVKMPVLQFCLLLLTNQLDSYRIIALVIANYVMDNLLCQYMYRTI